MVTGYAGGVFDDEGEGRGARLDEVAEGVEEVGTDWLGNEFVGHGTQQHDRGCHGSVCREDGGGRRHVSWGKHGRVWWLWLMLHTHFTDFTYFTHLRERERRETMCLMITTMGFYWEARGPSMRGNPTLHVFPFSSFFIQ